MYIMGMMLLDLLTSPQGSSLGTLTGKREGENKERSRLPILGLPGRTKSLESYEQNSVLKEMLGLDIKTQKIYMTSLIPDHNSKMYVGQQISNFIHFLHISKALTNLECVFKS